LAFTEVHGATLMSNPKPVIVRGVAGVEPAAGGGTATWPEPAPPPNRHAAISRQLGTYTSYRTWAEKMKSSFEPGVPPAPVPRSR
jgi:hypothetical protein